MRTSAVRSESSLLTELLRHPHLLGHALGYNRLTELHSKWIWYLFDMRNPDVTLQAHRNSYKTTCIVVGMIWSGIVAPNLTRALIRKTATDAGATLQEIAAHYERPELRAIYRALGYDSPKGNRWRSGVLELASKTRVSKEGSFEAAGIADSLTGRHYDLILTDDIVTLRDRISKAERETVKSYFRELHNVKTSKTGRIASSGTPWARDDAFTIMPPAARYPYTETGILDADTIKSLRDSMPYSLFAANYELKHVADEDKIFSDPSFADWPKGRGAIAFVDPAYGGGNNTALAIGMKGKDGRAVVRGRTWTRNVVDLWQAIRTECEAWNVGTVYFESNKDEGASAREFRKHWPAVAEYKVFKNKHVRILDWVKKYWKRIDFAHDCDEKWLANVLDYEEGEEPDDEVDALAGLVEKLGIGSAPVSFGVGAPSVMS